MLCNGHQLAISARDIPLASILAEVGRCIGVKIDVPPEAADSRFFDSIGPGPVHEVLGALLNATGFNYVIGSSNTQPDKVETVLLMARTVSPADSRSDPAGDPTLTPARRAFVQMHQAFSQHQSQVSAEEESSTTDPVASSDPAGPGSTAPA